jgi:hypothetical protein
VALSKLSNLLSRLVVGAKIGRFFVEQPLIVGFQLREQIWLGRSLTPSAVFHTATFDFCAACRFLHTMNSDVVAQSHFQLFARAAETFTPSLAAI